MIAIEVCSQQPFRFGLAWLFLSTALAVHVVDEALTDFLAVYNPAVLAIRKRIPFLRLPTFTFPVWFAGLCLGITVAFGLSFLAFCGSRVAVVVAYPVAVLMFVNGLGHIGATLYRRRIMPGFYSSPFLVAASAYLFYCTLGIANSPNHAKKPTASAATVQLRMISTRLSAAARPRSRLVILFSLDG